VKPVNKNNVTVKANLLSMLLLITIIARQMRWPARSHLTVEECLALGYKEKRTPIMKRS